MTISKNFPDIDDARLTETISGFNQDGEAVDLSVIVEKPLTLYLNRQEIVTLMTIGDDVEALALGFLINQNMLGPDDRVVRIDYQESIETVVVRTAVETDYEDKMKKRIRTSGCAQGTVFGDIMEEIENTRFEVVDTVSTGEINRLLKTVSRVPNLYKKAGAIHGCALCTRHEPLVYTEDVGRHNAIDKIAGIMYRQSIAPEDKIFYTTGRLTSEMVIKTIQMRIPLLLSRSGFTAWGVELAHRANLTLIGRAKGSTFKVLAGADRLTFEE